MSQSDHEFVIEGDTKLLVLGDKKTFSYTQVYDIEKSIEELFTEVENLKPVITNIWHRPGMLQLQQALTMVNEGGSLTVHFYDFRKSPEPVGRATRIANGSVHCELNTEGFGERDARILLWMIPILHKTYEWYDPNNTIAPEGFRRDNKDKD